MLNVIHLQHFMRQRLVFSAVLATCGMSRAVFACFSLVHDISQLVTSQVQCLTKYKLYFM